MAVDIKAVYTDMIQCKTVMEEIGEDVRKALTELDSFLNTKVDCNGTMIYANWNSTARDLFVTKMDTVFSSFRAVANECDNAANSLTMAANAYVDRDKSLKEISDVQNSIQPVNFNFNGQK